MKICKTCKINKPYKDFPTYGNDKKRSVKYRPHCFSCKYKKAKAKETEKQKENKRKYLRDYHRKNPLNAKVKAYQHSDRKRNTKSIKLKEARELIEISNCFYCGESEKIKLGLDRIDNNDGHHKNNVVVCCEKCNNILGDIPFKAKELLADGLRKIKQQEILIEWEIPTKRKKKL